MKVLHVWNTAGVGSVIAKYMDRLYNTESLVAHRRAYDPYGFTTYGTLWDCGAKIFALKCLLEARKYDVIHLHSQDKFVPYLKLLYRKKPVVLHYHGTDIRGKWRLKRKYWSKANMILYSTLDLSDDETPEHAVYIPNPVDTSIFHACAVKPKHKTAFHISYNADDLAVEYAEKYDLTLTIYNREKQGAISHLELPKVLTKYEYYIDVKRVEGRMLKVPLSKTALEALACGLKVISWEGDIVKGLPPKNLPEDVISCLFNEYEHLLR